MNSYPNAFNARTLPLKLALGVLALGMVHVIAIVLYWEDLIEGLRFYQISVFDLDEEESFGTWYVALLHLFAGRLLLHHWRAVKAQGHWLAPWWLVLAIGFHYLSIDEVVAIHEVLNQSLMDTPYRWTRYGIGVSIVVGVVFVPFLWNLPRRTMVYFVIGGAVFLGGAVGVERATDWYQDAGLLKTTEYNLWTALEECMEMMGVVIFLRGLLGHMAGEPRGTVRTETALEDWPPQRAARRVRKTADAS